MKEYVHAFALFDSPLGIGEFKNATKLTLKCFRELLEMPEADETKLGKSSLTGSFSSAAKSSSKSKSSKSK